MVPIGSLSIAHPTLSPLAATNFWPIWRGGRTAVSKEHSCTLRSKVVASCHEPDSWKMSSDWFPKQVALDWKNSQSQKRIKKPKGKNTTSPHLPQPPPGLGPIAPPTTQTTRTRTYIITPNWAHYVPSLNARLQGCVANLQIKSLHVISYLVHMKIDGTWDILLDSGEVSRW